MEMPGEEVQNCKLSLVSIQSSLEIYYEICHLMAEHGIVTAFRTPNYSIDSLQT